MNFFAYLARTKNITRWSLMRNSHREDVAEHSFMVTVFADALCTIENTIFGGNLDEVRVLKYAVYHDVSEVLTGDLPSPIKYFNSEIRIAYGELENFAEKKLVSMLPEKLRDTYAKNLICDKASPEYAVVKIADKLSAYIKCVEEIKSGNADFSKAKITIEKDLKSTDSLALKYFLENFEKSFSLTLDELE